MDNIRIEMPSGAKAIIEKLEKTGHEAFIVGGCVRDALRGARPNDWDICTSALPEETLSLFRAAGDRVIETGIKHGTVTVLYDGVGYEVTTYRIDGAYRDNRHPESVTFTARVEDDLARRDFTVNAMAYSEKRGIIDPFNGRADLKMKLLRCVGDPETRFSEDGLRILRAMRFSSQLSFSIEGETSATIHELKGLIGNISAERVRDELVKLVMGEGVKPVLAEYRDVMAEIIPELEPCFDFEQHNRWHIYDVWQHIIESVTLSERDEYVRLAMLLHDIGKPSCFTLDERGVGHFYGHADVSEQLAHVILRRLRFDNDTIAEVTELIKYHDMVIVETPASIRRLLGRLGEERFSRLLSVRLADAYAQAPKSIAERLPETANIRRLASAIISEGACIALHDLAINGRDLIEAGFLPGPVIGRVLDELLNRVIDDPALNTRELLLKIALSMKS